MAGTILSRQDGEIAFVILSNPDKLNAVDSTMWRELRATFEALGANDALRCIIVQGEGQRAFAAGGDIEEFAVERDTLEKARRYHEEWVAGALQAISQCPHPTVAMIRGACVGGGLEIAAACDLRIAGVSSRFGAPINRLGFPMHPWELASLIALAGPALMREILLEGRLLEASEALAKGLLTRVVDDEIVEEEAMATARRIAAGAPLVARWHKQSIRRLSPPVQALSEEELLASYAWLNSEDYKAGFQAFLGKTKPVFKGR